MRQKIILYRNLGGSPEGWTDEQRIDEVLASFKKGSSNRVLEMREKIPPKKSKELLRSMRKAIPGIEPEDIIYYEE